MMIDYFVIIGALGLILISLGILTRKRKKQDKFYIVGGIGLLIYSVSLINFIFIILQTIFILSASYDLIKQK
ncbi:MAG: hypothetical protein KKF68_02670 [Nanoarchaeota archaeon]|nr:hypothetical protein [Nanoarchaeota archaeon]